MHVNKNDSPVHQPQGKTSKSVPQTLTGGDKMMLQRPDSELVDNGGPQERHQHVYSKIHSGAVGSRTTTLYLSRATTKVSLKDKKGYESNDVRKLENSSREMDHGVSENYFQIKTRIESEIESLGSPPSAEFCPSQKDTETTNKSYKEESNQVLDTNSQDVLTYKDVSVPVLAREFTRMLTFADTSLDISDIKGLQYSGREHLTENQEETLYRKMYTEACQLLRVIPVSQVIRSIMGPSMELQRYSLGPKGIKSVVISLVNNIRVTRLNAAENDLGPEGAVAISQLIQENNFITDLTELQRHKFLQIIGDQRSQSVALASYLFKHKVMSSNNIRSEGVKAICDAVKGHTKLRRLNLSHNQLKDNDAYYIADILRGKCAIQELNLSNNQFREQGGVIVGKAIAQNESLHTLDISWNHLRGKGGVGICRGLQENVGLQSINISWNGLGKEGGRYLAYALASNRTLKELDVTNNRLSTEDMGVLLKGLQHNDSLQVLRIGSNPFSSQMAYSLLQVTQLSDMPLQELDIQDIPVSVDFQSLAKYLLEERGLRVRHGAVIMGRSSKQKPKRNNEMTANPLKIFFTHLSKQGMRVIDLYKRFDTGKRDHLYITKQQFRDGISSINIPLLSGGVEQIVDKIESRNETVDLVLLFEEEKQFRKKLIQNRTQKTPKPLPILPPPGKARRMSTLKNEEESLDVTNRPTS